MIFWRMQHGGIVYMQERIAFVDVYSEYLIITGIETDRSNATVLKHIKAFTKHPDFTNHYNNLPFTLILHKYKEVSEQINQKIAPFKGSIIFNDPLVAQIIEPVVRELYNNMVHKKTSHC